jgi:hypothetical protein
MHPRFGTDEKETRNLPTKKEKMYFIIHSNIREDLKVENALLPKDREANKCMDEKGTLDCKK